MYQTVLGITAGLITPTLWLVFAVFLQVFEKKFDMFNNSLLRCVEKGHFLLIFSTIYANVGGRIGPEKAKNLLM